MAKRSQLFPVVLLYFVSRLLFCYGVNYYEELKTLNASCFPKDTCSVLRQESSDNLLYNSCECGQFCTKHSSCCIDSPFLNLNTKRNNRDGRKEICAPLFGTQRRVFGVSECQSDWNGEDEVKQMCEDDTPDFSDPISWTPSTNSKTGITYKNYFCAICNDDLEDLTMWNIKIQTDTEVQNSTAATVFSELVFDKIGNVWSYMFDDGHTEDVVLGYQMPQELDGVVKECVPNLVSDCSPSWRDAAIRQKCLSYMGVTYTPTQINETYSTIVPYRNIHCAMCNHAKYNETQCTVDVSEITTYTHRSMTFTVLFRPDVAKRNSPEDDTEVEVKTCNQDQSYNKKLKKCLHSFKPPVLKKTDGTESGSH